MKFSFVLFQLFFITMLTSVVVFSDTTSDVSSDRSTLHTKPTTSITNKGNDTSSETNFFQPIADFSIQIKEAITSFFPKKNSLKTKDSNVDSKHEIVLVQQTDSNWKKDFLFYTKEILLIVGLVLGLMVGYPFLSRKLLEYEFQVALSDIQENNKTIRKLCNEYIDESFTNTYKSVIVTRDQIQKIYEQTCEIYKNAVSASQEVATLCFLLKKTFQGYLKYYPDRSFLDSRSIYSYYNQLLYTIIQFTTKTVTIPKSTKLIRKKYLFPVLKKYLDEYNFGKIKQFEIGYNISPTSAIVFTFFNITNQLRNKIMMRSFYKIIHSSQPCLREMYLSKVYFPLSLEYGKTDDLFGKYSLNLVGFHESTEFNRNGEKKDIISFILCNPNDTHHFCDTLKLPEVKEKFKDSYIEEFDFSKLKIKSMIKHKSEIMEFQLELKDSKSNFTKFKKVIETKMKQEVQNRKKY